MQKKQKKKNSHNQDDHRKQGRNEWLGETASGGEITLRPNVSSSQLWQWKTNLGEKKKFHPSARLCRWHSERYLPYKVPDISLCALITPWNMNKSEESVEWWPAELLLTAIDYYWGRRRRKKPSEGPQGATFYWSSVNLVTRSTRTTVALRGSGTLLSELTSRLTHFDDGSGFREKEIGSRVSLAQGLVTEQVVFNPPSCQRDHGQDHRKISESKRQI